MITGSITTVAAIALLSSPLGEAAAQERSPLPPPLPTDWRITFGTSSGRVHENVVRYTVTDRGQLIRTRVEGVRIVSRSSQGVIVFDTAEDERVVAVERLSEEGEENGG